LFFFAFFLPQITTVIATAVDEFVENEQHIGITPFANWGGPYPLPNFQLNFSTVPGVPWPAPATPLHLSVPSGATGVSVPFPQGRPGLPIRAGYTLGSAGGSRHHVAGGVTNLASNAVPGLGNTGLTGSVSSTLWRATDAPNITHYPMYIALGGAPTASGHNTATFLPVQLEMPDINLNVDNHLAIANPTPTPIHQYTSFVFLLCSFCDVELFSICAIASPFSARIAHKRSFE